VAHMRSYLFKMRQPPSDTLFPYTTLFRSVACSARRNACTQNSVQRQLTAIGNEDTGSGRATCRSIAGHQQGVADCRTAQINQARSEEHTSERQTRENLVCRLLLEKKKGTI